VGPSAGYSPRDGALGNEIVVMSRGAARVVTVTTTFGRTIRAGRSPDVE